MVRLCRHLLWIVLLCGGISLYSAETAENKAFTSSAKKFEYGLWGVAANDFAAFVTNFPTSFRVPEAILYQGQALIKSSNFVSAVDLLSSNQRRAGELEDIYLYWIAYGHLGNTNYSAAAKVFGRLVQDFPASTNRLAACIGQAAALAKLEDWPQVAEVLGRPAGFFQQTAAMTTNDLVARGFLLLGEAELTRKNLKEAAHAAASLSMFGLKPEFAWQRWYLQSRIELADGRLEDAKSSSTNLIVLAEAAGSSRLKAESRVLIASILEKENQFAQAIAVHEENLSTNAPVAQQRTALLKIAELNLAQNKPEKLAEAVLRLETYRTDYPQSEAADMVLLTLGELQLKQAVTGNELSTNLLGRALARFDGLLTNFPNSSLIGKAHLGKGWCLWYGTNFAGAESAFRAALDKLPFSEDQAVARFKLADVQFIAGNFNGAITNYQQLVDDYISYPDVRHALLEQALYQTVRAALSVDNLAVASNAVQKILEWYPDGLLGDRCLLLVAEGFTQHNAPAEARRLLTEFEERYGSKTNARLPHVRLAISRTYEKEGNWAAAITNYDSWISTFTDHVQMPEARFARAWDTAMAGAETNALAMFNSFVADFPAHDLAARAKWWIGDYHFQRGDWGKAEENYPYTTNYAGSELFFPAHLRAGAAAMARSSYKDAISYFTNLRGNPKAPNDLKIKAAMAAGDAYIARNEAGATNRVSDLEEAIENFNYVLKTFPASPQVPLAWGRLGDCYKELGTADPKQYEKAVETYGKVVASPLAPIAAKRQAQIGLGIVAEAQADGKSGPERQALLNEALARFSEAFTFEALREGETDDLFWFQKSGLETARVAELMGEWQKAVKIYRDLQRASSLSPVFRSTIDRKLGRALENQSR
jgi:TolA-binding protein